MMYSDSSLFPVVKEGKALRIMLDDFDFKGIRFAAEAFAGDVCLVTGMSPEICTISDVSSTEQEISSVALLAGTAGHSRIIDVLAADGVLNLTAVQGKWETYTTAVIENPARGISRAIVVAGSDKRGTVYGIYRLSELIGISPWIWWADVLPQERNEILLPVSDLTYTSKEPSVKYRGFFINDEWPSFGKWTVNRFGGFNEKMYAHVFELILRLKGNLLWPAMWNAVFSEDGESCPQANAELADEYGIVMGTSHHEPMFRAGEEWQKEYAKYGSGNVWDFLHNRNAVTEFWRDGVARNGAYEKIVTLGMRGERDSALGGSMQRNIELLKDCIMTQRRLLDEAGLSDCPKILTLYKEVENFWYGTEVSEKGAASEGLCSWKELDDVTIMLCDDNFGNVRTLPRQEERNRSAGWGMYYHVDYHGAPNSYEWINTVQPEKIQEQMSMAYDYGVRTVWILNVGDLKPMELPLSYFLDLAYDFEKYGTNAPNSCRVYLNNWVEQQFRPAFSALSDREHIAEILASYTKLNTIRKPEVTFPDTFPTEKEAGFIRSISENLEQEAGTYYGRTPDRWKDAFYELVYFPAVASANVKLMNLAAAAGDAAGTDAAIKKDIQLNTFYNTKIAGGKWNGMMSSPHIGYAHWDAAEWKYPAAMHVIRKIRIVSRIAEIPAGLPAGTFLEDGGIVSIEASHTSARSECDGVHWFTLENYGRTLSAVKMYPDTVSFPVPGAGPYLAYRLYLSSGGTYTLTLYTTPANNLFPSGRLRIAYSTDAGQPVSLDTLPEGFKVDIFNTDWSRGVLENIRRTKMTLQLMQGMHTLRLFGMDAGVTVEKIVLTAEDAGDDSYLGAPESRRSAGLDCSLL